jgi:hypothetical protein
MQNCGEFTLRQRLDRDYFPDGDFNDCDRQDYPTTGGTSEKVVTYRLRCPRTNVCLLPLDTPKPPVSVRPNQATRRMAGFRISDSEADRRESTHSGLPPV